MISLLKKYFGADKIPYYLIFDFFNVIASMLIVNLYEQKEIWFISYFFVYLVFCLAIFLKQHDKQYLKGLQQFKEDGIFEWVVLFCCMLFPGWLAGPALLGYLGYSVGEISYTESVLPLMIIYPLVFGFFPFRKAEKKYFEKMLPLSKGSVLVIRIVPNFIIYVFAVYLQVFYFDIISNVFYSDKIASMDMLERLVTLFVSMVALLVMYIPVRIHFFFVAPGNRVNKVSFIVTIVLISVYSVTGLDVLF